ncbi:chymotrypsin-1 [Bombyx mori]|uniref:Peptidase S1 domain-containing protein n=1 Tax=Bombyx mori TaxID=7091 RepID=A0A8R2R5H1_BOMMO|nr:chymotrypsin-1 [Bombyx mori]XP_037877702.1 chymotrypsin-1 [Bombyx mori]XP_037877703.1 chymotrypsin-1 [Bombyx mori]
MYQLTHHHVMSLILLNIVYSSDVLDEKVIPRILNLHPIQHTTSHMEGKVVGGKSGSLEQFPFQAQVYNLGAICAGTILNSWTILTVAHCFDHNKNVRELEVQTGSKYLYGFKAKKYNVSSLVVHKAYNTTAQFSNDIALIFLTSPVEFGKLVQKGILVDNGKWMSKYEKNFIVSGWGWTQYGGPISQRGLLTTHLGYVPSRQCGRFHNLSLTPDMFCLYGDGERDTCKGDSGTGVLWNGYIVGITSHGDGCAKKYKPSVYTNVWYFRDWIEKHINNFFKAFCKFNQTSVQKKLKTKT